MASLNRIQLIGHLGSEPEMRFTPAGKSVCSFSLATSRRYQRDGEWQEETTWFTITAWNKTAERANQYLSKGSKVYVEGSVKLHEWEAQDGSTKSRLEVTASNLIMLDKKRPTEDDGDDDTLPVDIPF